MYCVQLKVKIKSLAAEAHIIRFEETKTKSDKLRGNLRQHRISVVRFEARHSLLLYGFMRGKKYSDLEQFAKESPDWDHIIKMGYRFYVGPQMNELKYWCKLGEEYIQGKEGHQLLSEMLPI